MKKVFGRKKSSNKLNGKGTSYDSSEIRGGLGAPPPLPSSSNGGLLLGANYGNHQGSNHHTYPNGAGGGKRSTDSSTSSKIHVDDFGRPIVDHRPAFGKDSLTTTLSDHHQSHSLPSNSGAALHHHHAPGYAVSSYDDDLLSMTGGEGSTAGGGVGDLQLLFGYAPIESLLELSIEKVADLVMHCAEQIRTRGLDTPLILSSMSLDLSMEGTCSLIRTYLADPQAWAYDLQLASPLCVGAQLKWGLARLVNDRGGRGFVSWDLYNDWKQSEKATGYPARHCSNLISRLATSSAQLLTELLSLFSSISAHGKANGMPPRKLASLFSPYIFGLADDEPFDVTYEQWQRATNATEHILLAFIRDQQAREGTLPTYLENHLIGYPQTLNLHYGPGRASSKPPQGARVEELVRIRRLTRFHSRNLIASAGTWAVPNSLDWALFFPLGYRPKTVANASSTNPPVSQYTSYYRHLLNIRGNNLFDDEDDDGELQRYKSTVEKDWSKFGELGFKDVEPSKLEFDLTESERLAPIRKRDTMDWGTFADSGFGGRETFRPNDLIFHQSINTRVNTWPASQQALDNKLRAAEKMLPSFPYDTTPREEARVVVDALFFEAWADVLVSGGWARDELKESSFALIQWKARPREGEAAKGRTNASGDDRTEDRWVLVEEFVPKEYRDELAEGKQKKPSKRISFMRSVRRKTSKPSALRITHPHHAGTGAVASTSSLVSPPISSSYAKSHPQRATPAPLKTIDESVFASSGAGATTPTKIITLSRTDVDQSGATQSMYAPSVVSTNAAAHSHGGPPTSNMDGRFSGEETARDSASIYDQTQYAETPRAQSFDLPPPVPSVSTDGMRMHGLGTGVSSAKSQASQGSSQPAWIRDRNSAGSASTLSPTNDNRAGGLGYTKPSSNGAKGFISRMTSRTRKRSEEQPRPFVGISNNAPSSPPRVMPLTTSALAQHTSPSPPSSTQNFSGPAPDIMVQSPSTNMVRSESGGPPPPLPPKSLQDLRPSTPEMATSDDSHHRPGVRDSVMTAMTDPYGGMESAEEAEVGQVMYRQDESAPDASPRRVLLSDVVGGSPLRGTESEPPLSSPPPPNRHDSLPPSPKPDAEVPTDVGTGRDSRFMSGIPIPKGRTVGQMVGKIEEGKVGKQDNPVRLTQYGFQ